jgi:transcriptional regulator with XRE-family HTH domain
MDDLAKYLKILSINIGLELVRREIKQADLARKTGFKTSTISQIMSMTNKNPSLRLLVAISKALEMPISVLLGEPAKPDHPLEECYRRVGAALKK